MSQTDSLEEIQLQPEFEAQLQQLAARLALETQELEKALQQLAAASPISLRIGLQLLKQLTAETDGWKFVPQTQLLLFVLQGALAAAPAAPELLRLCEMLEHTYPEYFEQDFWHA